MSKIGSIAAPDAPRPGESQESYDAEGALALAHQLLLDNGFGLVYGSKTRYLRNPDLGRFEAVVDLGGTRFFADVRSDYTKGYFPRFRGVKSVLENEEWLEGCITEIALEQKKGRWNLLPLKASQAIDQALKVSETVLGYGFVLSSDSVHVLRLEEGSAVSVKVDVHRQSVSVSLFPPVSSGSQIQWNVRDCRYAFTNIPFLESLISEAVGLITQNQTTHA